MSSLHVAWLAVIFQVASAGTPMHRRMAAEMTTQERRHLFGSESLTDVPHYEVTFARAHAIHKRSLLPNRDLFYHINVDGQPRTLHLLPNRNLLSPHFTLKPEGLGVNISSVRDCLYQGKFTTGAGRAAISTCGSAGLTGMIETETGRRYQLHPAPARFQENVTDQGHMHLLVPRKNESDSETFCGVQELNVPQRLVSGEDQPLMTDWNATPMSSRRHRREAIPDKLYIETAVFADYMLYKTLVGKTLLHDHDAFVKYILAIVNTVQLIYNEQSLGRSVEIVLVRLEILQNENLPFYNEEVDKYLWDFCKWQSNLNPGTDLSTPNHWDHAIILTGFDLRSGSMRSVTGYAPVGGMCNPMYSCTINEGNHFGAAFVIAHEMGHSLTMQHDGQAGISGNGCDAQRYLMSPSTGRGKTTWSTCSRSYLDAFLVSQQSQCLKDVPPGHPHDISAPGHPALDLSFSSLPGQLYPADDQCKLLYGLEFHRYATQPSSDVCEILICANTTVYITGHPALPGTFCGEGHWCSGGACVSWGSGGPLAIDGGWSAWPATADCTTDCLLSGTGVRIFERSCTNPTPANGGKSCEGKSKRYRMCDDAAACAVRTVSTIANYANRQCLTTKTVQTDLTLTGSGRQRLQDPTGGCVIWCDTFQGGYKTWGAKFPDGTDCSGGGVGVRAYCLEGQCRGFGCDGWTMDETSPDACRAAEPSNSTITPVTFPTESVINLVTPRTTISTTPNLIGDSAPTFPSFFGTPDPKWLENGPNSVATTTTKTTTSAPNLFPPTFPSLFVAPRALLFSGGSPFNTAVIGMSPTWGAWATVGICVSNCLQNSVALQKVVRKCESPPQGGGGTCVGRNATVMLCPLACPNVFYSADSYVTKICSALKTVDQTLTGLGKQLPQSADDPRQSCKLWCQTAGSHLRSWPEMFFPDGTVCATDASGAKSYCVRGSCTRFNCDGKPVDSSDPPKCEIQSSSKLLLPKPQPRHISGGKPSLIEQPQSGRIPNETVESLSPFHWMTVSTSCSKSCGGGTRKNHVQCTETGRSRSKGSQRVGDEMCVLESKPTVELEETCNTQPCPQWSASKWSDCGGSCGNATMTRLVQCVQASPPVGTVKVETIVDDSQCDTLLKPEMSQVCMTHDCALEPLVFY
ncbi:A disintegrin and metalloproteinase with thrombospondin motifs 16 [Hypsibius exemplaris]|uniref:A disintegrin and metalloproteinase with thrombospondin motifs 16 n=1 Tax=Hypsibius exemplaris TaxID=2072580 RepID=A0A1W0WY88_HYPEX|nr:A disintegrin and metalloproteinase with thrombospondin motifs 16 [Hypsibius exemplaris]